MKLPFAVLCAGIALLHGTRAPAQSSQGEDIAALRRQVDALTGKVNELQQQINKGRLVPMFGEGTTAGGGKPIVTNEAPSAFLPPKETNLAIFNPEISAAIDFVGSYSRRADNVNFIVRDAEIMLQANVDQLAHAYAVFNAETEFDPARKTDPFDEIKLGVEEAAVETTALPYGLKIKAGLFFADFTRLGKVHSHDLPFTDRPASLAGIIGGEDKARGLEFSWIPPLGHYVRLTAGAVDSIGADTPITSQLRQLDGRTDDAFSFRRGAHRSFGDIVYYGRAATIFELGPQVNLNVGADYARGRDRGERQLASADFKLSWTPRPDSYDLFELSGEYLWGRNRGALADEAVFADGRTAGTASAHGGYVYAQYKIGKTWQPGLRFDYLHADSFAQRDLDGDGSPDRLDRLGENTSTYSAYLNYYLSEFSRLRLEVSYVKGDHEIVGGSRDDWQTFLQWTVTLGPHKHPFTP